MKGGWKCNKTLPFQLDYRKFACEPRCSSSKFYLRLRRSEIIEQEGWLDRLFLSSCWMEVWVHYCDGSQLDTDEWGFGKILAFSQFLKTLILSFSGSEDWISFNNLQSSSSWESCLISSAQLKRDVGFIYRLLHSQSLRCKVPSADKILLRLWILWRWVYTSWN